MGHAGAIISGGKGGAEHKIKNGRSGITIAKSPSIIGKTLFNKLSNWKIILEYYIKYIDVIIKKSRIRKNFIFK